MGASVRRVAAIYDIHANLPALEAVCEEIGRAGVDAIVVGGDVLPGPMPRETLAFLRSLPVEVRFIRGNGDREVLAERRRPGASAAAVPEQFREAMRWVARELEPEDEQLLDAWPSTLMMDVEGLGPILFCHATPRSDTELFSQETPEAHLLLMLGSLDVSTLVCGHTHMQFDRLVGRVRIVNAGSVGMPCGEPGAYWLLLGPDVELRRTPYDMVKAAERIRRTAYPQAAEFAAHSVLQPPPERGMLDIIARATGREERHR